ncbi:MAG: SagB/ThcOx family dehydrogenase [Desulfobacteraceae bacterium]|nr:SagB/ThcOx family dehydrogenase [Desulfobacteraceae bacterium]
MASDVLQKIIHYHEATKHHRNRYARSAGYLDWDNQPHPFRFYHQCPMIRLPFLDPDPSLPYDDMYAPVGNSGNASLTGDAIAGFLELSLGLSAWKSQGAAKWALRMNPSSGNLHPTEAHVILPGTDVFEAGIYHYSPYYHALEQRAAIPNGFWDQSYEVFGSHGFFIGLTTVFWRESWKYGERAYRYCNLDTGHALAALAFSAALFGWHLNVLDHLSDDEVAMMLGLNKVVWRHGEGEHPDLICFVSPDHTGVHNMESLSEMITAVSTQPFSGMPNQLSGSLVHWEIIEDTAMAARKPDTPRRIGALPAALPSPASKTTKIAAAIIRQRRSAVSYDNRAIFPQDRFYSLLNRTLPSAGGAPFGGVSTGTAINLLMFIHLVEGLDQGLYYFLRDKEVLDGLRKACTPSFLWKSMSDDLPLYLLKKGDMTDTAADISCNQDIAGMSCFSMGMIADFSRILEGAPYRYRHLFREAGMVGQVLYLEAEAHGFRGTGIGCFFDDEVHRLMGLPDKGYQSLYHFTIGRPVADNRLKTLAPYHHLQNGAPEK